jgi:preprotein translocase subunit SecD
VTADYAGKTYLLLSNRPNDVVINSPGQAPWGISDAFASTDETGRPAVDITFDDTAAKLLTKLTGAHRRNGTRPGDHLAIVVKGEVYSLPTIQTTVSDMCQISGKFTQNDVSEMVNLLTKGS